MPCHADTMPTPKRHARRPLPIGGVSPIPSGGPIVSHKRRCAGWLTRKGFGSPETHALIEHAAVWLADMAKHQPIALPSVYSKPDEAEPLWDEQLKGLLASEGLCNQLRQLAAWVGEPWRESPAAGSTPVQKAGEADSGPAGDHGKLRPAAPAGATRPDGAPPLMDLATLLEAPIGTPEPLPNVYGDVAEAIRVARSLQLAKARQNSPDVDSFAAAALALATVWSQARAAVLAEERRLRSCHRSRNPRNGTPRRPPKQPARWCVRRITGPCGSRMHRNHTWPARGRRPSVI
jgi:hypothetical protein